MIEERETSMAALGLGFPETENTTREKKLRRDWSS